MINLKVELKEKSYPIYIGNDILSKLGEMYKIYNFGKQVVVITDSNVQKHYGDQLMSSFKGHIDNLEFITLPAGESSKSLATIERIITRMLELNFERNVVLIAFGGGVIGDITGFAASIYKRGAQFIQVPTTLLAQVDASIGGKTGVNHPAGKNMIGTFYQPGMVWTDLAVLKTLPRKEIMCGLGEIIKYGVIKDAQLFTIVEENIDRILSLDLDLMQEIVQRCCEIKAEIVAADEKERELRIILNFGHTIGHALEAAVGYKKLSHGEAVILGMLAESKIAFDLKILNMDDFNRIHTLISNCRLFSKIKSVNPNELFQFIKADKKNLDGKVRLVIPNKIGEVVIKDNIEIKIINECIQYLFSCMP